LWLDEADAQAIRDTQKFQKFWKTAVSGKNLIELICDIIG